MDAHAGPPVAQRIRGRQVQEHATSRSVEFSVSAELEPNALTRVVRLLKVRHRVHKGEPLYRLGDEFRALFALYTGACKTVCIAKGGQELVTGYHMPGEIVGIDGIGSGAYECQAVALEDMVVCPLAYGEVEHLARVSDAFRRNLLKLLAQDNVRLQRRMLVLGTMRAEQRLAAFLLDVSQRNGTRGFSSLEFVLRLTRAEIGSHLGLALETVSRELSRLHRNGLIHMHGRRVKLLDLVALSRLADCDD